MGPDRNKHLRNIAIVLLLAVAVWKLPAGGTAAATISNVLSVAFVGGMLFFGYRLYMEHRDEIRSLDERRRGLLYAALALAAFALLATGPLWDSGGLGALVWLLMLSLSAWAIYTVWRAHRSY